MTLRMLRIDGIEPIEALELKEQLGGEAVETIQGPPPRAGTFESQDLISVAIQVAPSALMLIATLLARKRVTSVHERTIHATKLPDNTVSIDITETSTEETLEAPDKGVVDGLVKELSKLTGVPSPG